MTTNDGEQIAADQRLVAAIKKLGLFSRIDEGGRILASDGEKEYEVSIDLDRLLNSYSGGRRLRVGTSSLARLEGGDVSALFSWGVKRPPPNGHIVIDQPASPYYEPLQWSGDELVWHDDFIEAQGDDWKYEIRLITDGDEILGYRIHGGDIEESDDIGSSLLDGEPGERTLQDAKVAAQSNYAGRYLEIEQMLFDVVGGYKDDDGNPLTRRDAQGRIFCRVEQLGREVEIAVTLVDYGGFFDADAYRWRVCTRSVLAYISSGDWLEGMYEDMRRAGVLDSDDSQ